MVTVITVDPLEPIQLAVMVALPPERVLVRPLEPPASLTCAIAGAEDTQVDPAVMSCEVLSSKSAVAVKRTGTPLDTVGVEGLSWMETSLADVTVMVAVPESPPYDAWMVAVPAESAFAWPRVPRWC